MAVTDSVFQGAQQDGDGEKSVAHVLAAASRAISVLMIAASAATSRSAASRHAGALPLYMMTGSALAGGVVWMQSSVLDVKNVTFFDNSATGSGGAIYADTDSTLSGLASTFANNTAGSEGGAIYHNGFFPSMQLGEELLMMPGTPWRCVCKNQFVF